MHELWTTLRTTFQGSAGRQPHVARSAPSQGSHAGDALMRAAADGDLATVRTLLAAGAELETRNGAGRTALMLAAQGGHTAVVQALSAAGADIDGRDARNWSALMIAAQEGQLSVVRALARANARAAG